MIYPIYTPFKSLVYEHDIPSFPNSASESNSNQVEGMDGDSESQHNSFLFILRSYEVLRVSPRKGEPLFVFPRGVVTSGVRKPIPV